MTDCTSCNNQKFTKFNYKVYVSDNLEIQEREIPDLGTCKTFSNKGTCAREKNFEDGKNSNSSSPILWIDKTTAVRNRGAEQVEATLREELKK